MLLHHADQGAVQPEVRRPGPPLRAGPGGPADRGQQHQRGGAGGGDDHRGAAQHAVRRLAHAVRAGLRRPGRGALPGRPVPRRGLGRGHHPPAGVGPGGRAVRHGEQRRGVRRLAGPGTRRHHGDRGRAPAGAAVAAHAGRRPALRPVPGVRAGPRRPGAAGPGEPGTAPAGPAGRLGGAQGTGTPGPRRAAADPVPRAAAPRGHRPAGHGRAAARHHVHLQPGGLRGRGPAVPRCGRPAHLRGRGGGHHRDRRAAYPGHPRVRPAGARLPGVADRPAARDRGAPRRDAAHVQGSSRGTVRGRAGPRRVRHRDAGPGHQHARPGRWSSSGWTSGTGRTTPT